MSLDAWDENMSDFEELLLPGRIQTLTGDQKDRNVFRETREEVAPKVLKTIAMQFKGGRPSQYALDYVADRFTKYLESAEGAETLNDAFFLTPELTNQFTSEADKLDVCQAYQGTILHRSNHFDAATKTTEISPVTNAILEEAEKAATEAHYAKAISRIEHWEEKFTRTVKPILKEHGVFIEKVKASNA